MYPVIVPCLLTTCRWCGVCAFDRRGPPSSCPPQPFEFVHNHAASTHSTTPKSHTAIPTHPPQRHSQDLHLDTHSAFLGAAVAGVAVAAALLHLAIKVAGGSNSCGLEGLVQIQAEHVHMFTRAHINLLKQISHQVASSCASRYACVCPYCNRAGPGTSVPHSLATHSNMVSNIGESSSLQTAHHCCRV